ncbi:MAG: S8 family serine peptidase [Flavobacteriaceae bacterium]|nr:S8 family serine peptidase [Flavobacteriaceae bacterium]MDG1962051.1 S8 family serine peptidase [Flavobacteriaceae bacterium]
MRNLMIGLLLFVGSMSQAQIQDAWVFFADKENVQASLDNPLLILTQESLDRKALHEVVIDERDVPVNEAYIAAVKSSTGITVWAKSKWMNCVYVQGTLADIEALTDLSYVVGVEYADKDLNFPNPLPVVDKFELENQSQRIEYDYGAAANQIEMISGDFLHQEDFTGEGMIVAVMDSGFPNFENNPGYAHVMANNRLLGTYDFFSRTTDVTGTGSHGSSTTSDIGGYVENQFVGTAPNASFYLFRTEYGPSENPREEAWWVEALERADSLGVDVVNTSLGYQAYDNAHYDHSYEDLDGQTTFAARGANLAYEKGMLLVTSGGNQGNSFGTVATPADAIGILAVGAVNAGGNYVSFSSRGPTVDGRVKPDVMAQGQSAAVLTTTGAVDFSNGTSFSAPIIAGAVACLWQVRPETKNFELMEIIRQSAHLYQNPTPQMGYGIPNFESAYAVLMGLGAEDLAREAMIAIAPNPVQSHFRVSLPLFVGQAVVLIYDTLGQLIQRNQVTHTLDQVSMELLPRGLYLVEVKAPGVVNKFKILKQ